MKITRYITILFLTLLISCSEDYLDTKSGHDVADGQVFQTIEGAEAVLNGVYRHFFSNYNDSPGFQGLMGLNMTYDFRCEDIPVSRANWQYMDLKMWYSGHKWSTTHQNWDYYYFSILNVNKILDKYEQFNKTEKRDILEAQSRAIRAFAYFRLIRLYQHTYIGHENDLGVPLRLTPDKEPLPRAKVSEVYTQILSDLEQSTALLKGKTGRKHLSHINYQTACGLLARVHMEMQNWQKAKEFAIEAQVGTTLMVTDDYKAGFNDISNKEWIWGLEVQKDQSTQYISFAIYFTSNDPEQSYSMYNIYSAINKDLYTTMLADDIRRDIFNPTHPNWPYAQFKFKIKSDFMADYPLMRTSEMVLIEAEAAYNLGETANAQNLLAKLRKARSKVPANVATPTESGNDLLQQILLERRTELWGEGFRFFDLKRHKIGMTRGTQFVAGGYLTAQMMYLLPEEPLFNMQIPLKELETNPLIDPDTDQNPPARDGL